MYLSVVFQPLGGDLGNRVVLLGFALGNAGQLHWGTLAHRSEEVLVHRFLQTCGLFYTK